MTQEQWTAESIGGRFPGSRIREIREARDVLIVERLITKGFLRLLAPPMVYGQRRAATYVVLSSAAVREDQKRKGREWIIRTGRGISYARKLSMP